MYFSILKLKYYKIIHKTWNITQTEVAHDNITSVFCQQSIVVIFMYSGANF